MTETILAILLTIAFFLIGAAHMRIDKLEKTLDRADPKLTKIETQLMRFHRNMQERDSSWK